MNKNIEEPSQFRKNFGARLRQLRAIAGQTQEECAAALGVDRSYYAGLESAARNTRIDMLPILAKGFGISVAELFKGVEFGSRQD